MQIDGGEWRRKPYEQRARVFGEPKRARSSHNVRNYLVYNVPIFVYDT